MTGDDSALPGSGLLTPVDPPAACNDTARSPMPPRDAVELRQAAGPNLSGPPGPRATSLNTPRSAARITHPPAGIVVAMQNETSQLQNRESGMRVLRSRILAHQQEQIDAENSAQRKSQIRTMDRSERIRTYNYPENRIADHRTGYKAYNLDQVMNGDLEPVIQSAIEMDEQARLDAIGD